MFPTFCALYAAHRRVNAAHATLATILFFIGLAVYIANNTAFPMLSLSNQYEAAATDAQKASLVAAGQMMLALGISYAPGTFMGFLIIEVADVMISAVMLRGNIFSKVSAYAGIPRYTLLLVFEICSTFVPGSNDIEMSFAIGDGLLMMAWYILISRTFLQLGRLDGKETSKQI